MIAARKEYYLWKRVCLLPTILFIDIGQCRRADLDAKVKLILGNCWPFKGGDFPGRMERKVQAKDNRGQLTGAAPTSDQVIGSIEDMDKRRMTYLKKLMTKGEVFKAFRIGRKGTPIFTGWSSLSSVQEPGRNSVELGRRIRRCRGPQIKLIRSAPMGAS